MRSRRNTELLLLLAAAPAGAARLRARRDTALQRDVHLGDLAVPGALLAAFVVAHLAVRRFAPGADPALLPAASCSRASASRS